MNHFTLMHKDNALSTNTCHLISDQLIASGWIRDEENPELVIVVGGDGTMLRAIHRYLTQLKSVYFVGVHTGTLGFYTDFELSEVDELIRLIIAGDIYEIDQKSLLKVEILRETNSEIYFALNEMRIENPMRTQVLDVFIQDQYLETFKGNGLCLSSPSGSTAYNKSLGGAVTMPGIDVMQLTEIAPIRHNKYSSLNAPLLIPKPFQVKFVATHLENTILGVDHEVIPTHGAKEVRVVLSEPSVQFIRYRPYSFFKRIQKAFIFNS